MNVMQQERRRGPRARDGLMVMVVVALATAACTVAPEQDENPYAAEFAQARNEATTEAARAILADDVITAAEYQQTKEASVQCMRDQGLSVEATEEGGLAFEHVGSNWDTTQEESDAMTARIERTMRECEEEFDLAALESLYWSVTDNPQNTDLLQAVADCLVRGGHREKGYDKKDYVEEMSRYGTTAEVSDDGSGNGLQTHSEPVVQGAPPGPVPPPELTACALDAGL